MTFLNDLWKKLKTPALEETQETFKSQREKGTFKSKQEEESISANSPSPTTVLQNAESVLNAFDQHETEQSQADSIRANLKALKELVDKPKEDHPELRFTKIKQHLGAPECHETVRQERWQPNIHCPDCHSGHLKRLIQTSANSPFKHRYRCLDCGLIFNDDTGTPLERNIPALNIWMQCWYLMGCTESFSYIASKLNLDLATIEYMAEQLRLIFKAQQPLTRLINYEEWSKQSINLRNQLKEDLLKQYERLSADIATVPKDTAEFRRQQNLRRDLQSSTAPPTSGKKR